MQWGRLRAADRPKATAGVSCASWPPRPLPDAPLPCLMPPCPAPLPCLAALPCPPPAAVFNQFYTECQVVGSPEEESRLLLCEATALTMRTCFQLLGIHVLYRI